MSKLDSLFECPDILSSDLDDVIRWLDNSSSSLVGGPLKINVWNCLLPNPGSCANTWKNVPQKISAQSSNIKVALKGVEVFIEIALKNVGCTPHNTRYAVQCCHIITRYWLLFFVSKTAICDRHHRQRANVENSIFEVLMVSNSVRVPLINDFCHTPQNQRKVELWGLKKWFTWS